MRRNRLVSRLRKIGARLSHGNTPRWIAITTALLILIGAWAAVLIERPLDESDPKAVATQFMEDVRQGRPNHAYQLISEGFKASVTQEYFKTKTIPDSTGTWPNWEARYVGQQATQPDAKDDVNVLFVIPSDGEVKAKDVMIRTVKEGEVWRVESMSSITHIGGQTAPGAF